MAKTRTGRPKNKCDRKNELITVIRDDHTGEQQADRETILSDFRMYMELHNMAENTVHACLYAAEQFLTIFVIRIMAATGMRVSELIQLKGEDVKRGFMDLYSKDNKVRRIYIPKSVQKDCLKWLKNIGRTTGYVFLNRYGDRITPAGIRGQLKKFSILYGLDSNVVYPHSFRHLFARNFIEACGDISMLSDILGHESIETTRIYLPDVLCEEALEWCRRKGLKSGFLFLNKEGHPISARGIHSQLKHYALRYGINPDTVYPHSFRHRFAKNFLLRFNDISLLADLMGHESIETTRIYLTRSSKEQKKLLDEIITW